MVGLGRNGLAYSLTERRRRWLILAQGCFNPGLRLTLRIRTLKALAIRVGLANTFGVEFSFCFETQG
jgi:hypothetical protein